MAHPLRIQRSRKKGYRLPDDAVYVGRPTMWGNPFETAEEFRQWLAHVVPCEMTLTDFMRLVPVREAIEARVKELRGKQLACWCSLDKPCHADGLAELANK